MKWLKNIKQRLTGKVEWNYRVGFKPNSDDFVLFLDCLVDSDSLEWGLTQLNNKGVDLKVGESLDFTLEEIQKNSFALIKSVPLTKICEQKHLVILHKSIVSYKIVKKYNGIAINIIIEGKRRV